MVPANAVHLKTTVSGNVPALFHSAANVQLTTSTRDLFWSCCIVYLIGSAPFNSMSFAEQLVVSPSRPHPTPPTTTGTDNERDCTTTHIVISIDTD